MRETMNHLNITFIGGGNMAEALISGLISAGHPSKHLCVSDISAQRLSFLAEQYGICTHEDNVDAVQGSDVVLLAVKPQQMDMVLEGIAECLDEKTTVISIAAGVELNRMRAKLPENITGLIRVMPNTPALVGAGMSVLYSEADTVHKERAEYILTTSGEVAWVDQEKYLHAVTAVSGSGPAYFFLMAEIMQASGEALGLPKALAAQLAAQTAMGSGKMLVESGRTAAELRAQVTSPNGTTQAALDTMYECGLPDAVRKGVAAASKRSKELAA